MKNNANIAKAIRLAWDSLDSHLDSAKGEKIGKECCDKAVGDKKFHVKCVREYAFIIQTLTDSL